MVEGEWLAVKVPKPNSAQSYSFAEEMLYLSLFEGKSRIVKVAHIDDYGLYLEFLDGVSFGSKQPLPFEKMLQAAKDIAYALHSMHKKGYIHGDIHADNLFI